MSLVWIRHAETGGEAEVPEDAVPIYRQSGWDLMPKKVVAERDKAAAEELAAAEQAMQELAAAATPETSVAAGESPTTKEND